MVGQARARQKWARVQSTPRLLNPPGKAPGHIAPALRGPLAQVEAWILCAIWRLHSARLRLAGPRRASIQKGPPSHFQFTALVDGLVTRMMIGSAPSLKLVSIWGSQAQAEPRNVIWYLLVDRA